MVFEWSLTPNSKPFSFPLSLTSIKGLIREFLVKK